MDYIFTLSESTHTKLRHSNGTTFITFVDFKRAFDRVKHAKEWIKLLKLGVSAKIVRIVTNSYSRATLKVIKPGLSKETIITEEVLQGEILSPLLLILYIVDDCLDVKDSMLSV